jgi:hypothetical protein
VNKIVALLIVGLVASGCATPRVDFAEECRAEVAVRPIPPNLRDEEQIRAHQDVLVRICESTRRAISRADTRDQNEQTLMPAIAILFGAASQSLATHNFYVYRVPEARRFISRSH